jgi:hypothetical protein
MRYFGKPCPREEPERARTLISSTTEHFKDTGSPPVVGLNLFRGRVEAETGACGPMNEPKPELTREGVLYHRYFTF